MTDVLTPGTLLAGRYRISSMDTRTPALSIGVAQDMQAGRQVVVHLFRTKVAAGARWRNSFHQEGHQLLNLPDLGQPQVLDVVSEETVSGLVCQPMEGEPLIEPGKAQDPASVMAWAIDISSLLARLHSLATPVFVRSSRAEILWRKSDGTATLLRFGVPEPPVATSLSSDVSPFQAPETFGNSPRELSEGADTYWLGSVMLLALNGAPPPTGLERASRPKLSRRAPNIPDTLWQLVTNMVSFKPSERPTAANILLRLQQMQS